VEIAPHEAGAGHEQDVLIAPGLGHFGLPNPDFLLGIALRYQIAQKIHACTDPHDPPGYRNDRARDVVDLLLLRDLAAVDRVVRRPRCRCPHPATRRTSVASNCGCTPAQLRAQGMTVRDVGGLLGVSPQ